MAQGSAKTQNQYIRKIIAPNTMVIEIHTCHRKPFIFHISFSTEVYFFKAQYVQGTPNIPMRARIDIRNIATFCSETYSPDQKDNYIIKNTIHPTPTRIDKDTLHARSFSFYISSDSSLLYIHLYNGIKLLLIYNHTNS